MIRRWAKDLDEVAEGARGDRPCLQDGRPPRDEGVRCVLRVQHLGKIADQLHGRVDRNWTDAPAESAKVPEVDEVRRARRVEHEERPWRPRNAAFLESP